MRAGDGLSVTSRTQMGSHALTLVEKLNGRGRGAHFHQFLYQVVRHAVKVRVEDDVVIDVDPCAGPLAQIERLGRQRFQRGLVNSHELRRPRAFSFAEWSLVDAVPQFADGLVQLLDGEELPVAQRRDDPTLGQLYARFDLGFVARLIGSCRNHAHAVVHGHLLVRRVEVGVVTAGFRYACLSVVGHDQLRHTLIELEGSHRCADPACQLLVTGGLGVGVGTGTQNRDK